MADTESILAAGAPEEETPAPAAPTEEAAPAPQPEEDSAEIPVEEPALLPALDPASLRPVLEGIVYVTEEPVTLAQLSNALQLPEATIRPVLDELIAEYNQPNHGLVVREVAGGFKMTTKPEHHEAIRAFAKSLKPVLKLSLAALETLATIAYKQPITAPEIMEIRGVQGAGVLKTLLDRKLIAASGRKNVIGRPILYKTTKDFLLQFGLKDLSELPSLKEFEDLRRLALSDEPAPKPAEEAPVAEEAAPEAPSEEPPQDENA